MVQRHFDLVLGFVQLIERTIPSVELAGMHPHSITLVPVWYEAPPHAIAHEVRLQPTSQTMFACGTNQTIGDEYKRSVRERYTLGSPQMSVEDVPETDLLKEGPDSENGSPRRGIEDLRIGR